MGQIQIEMEELEQNRRTEDTHRHNLQNTLDVHKNEQMQLLFEEKAIKKRCRKCEFLLLPYVGLLQLAAGMPRDSVCIW